MSKRQVQDFWEQASCGEEAYLGEISAEGYRRQAATRYQLEPFILDFARFDQYRGKRVLEIGVGLGADHQKFAEAGAVLAGTDLTHRAVAHTRRRFAALGLSSDLTVADAEGLPFADGAFDLVYSWGVLHHTPNTLGALVETHRILKPGGECRLMLYHKFSMVGFMLWLRYGLLMGRPGTSLDEVYSRYLESPGTKAYSRAGIRRILRNVGYDSVELTVHLSHGDLLSSAAGQRHQGPLLSLARRLWPRWAIRGLLPAYGLFMTIQAVKPLSTVSGV